MRLISIFVLFVIVNPAYSQEIALSFDDAPRKDGLYYSGMERTQILIEKLKNAGVEQVVFYCTPGNMTETGKRRLEMYSDAGHVIANHTYSHRKIDDMGIGNYIDDIRKAEVLLKDFPTFKKWFRYPYLDEGKDLFSRDKIREGLTEMDYVNGYVTVDNYDWYLEKLFQDALREGKDIDYYKLKERYIEHLWKSIQFYDDIAIKVLGRSPKHVLLLHENDLAAMYIGDLVEFLEEKGWKIISPEEAYEDPISTIIPDVLLNGQGRVGAIAKEKGFKGPYAQESEDMKYLDKYFADSDIFK